MELRHADVDHQGLLTVLGAHLYSSPLVAVRELIQNAHDSIHRRRLEASRLEASREDEVDDPARIDVIALPGPRTLTIRDNGAGLTREEIDRYLATIGAGYTRVLRAETGEGSLIGAFGLGFLSAYVVSEQVEVITTSQSTPDQTWRFLSRDGLRYAVTAVEGPPRPVGTEVILHLEAGRSELADPAFVGELLRRYCCLLPLPVFAPERVNGEGVPWREPPGEEHPARRHKRLLAVAERFQPHFGPLCAFEVHPTEDLVVRGVLWVQDANTWGSQDNRHASLFVRGMFISDEVRALLPDWAGFCGGVVECDALVPTASREDVQRDATFQAVQGHLAEALIAGLCALPQARPEAWRRVHLRHNEALRGAALVDPRLFEALGPQLTVPTSEGDLTMGELLAREAQVHINLGEDDYELVLHKALGRPVVNGTRYAAQGFARRWAERHGHPVLLLGTELGNRSLFPKAFLPRAHQARLEGWFAEEQLGVVPTRFAPASLPLVLIPDRDALLKQLIEEDEADKRLSQGILGLARRFTAQIEEGPPAHLYVNLDSPVIQGLLAAPEASAAAAAVVLKAFATSTVRSTEPALQRDLAATLSAMGEALLALLNSHQSGEARLP